MAGTLKEQMPFPGTAKPFALLSSCHDQILCLLLSSLVSNASGLLNSLTRYFYKSSLGNLFNQSCTLLLASMGWDELHYRSSLTDRILDCQTLKLPVLTQQGLVEATPKPAERKPSPWR